MSAFTYQPLLWSLWPCRWTRGNTNQNPNKFTNHITSMCEWNHTLELFCYQRLRWGEKWVMNRDRGLRGQLGGGTHEKQPTSKTRGCNTPEKHKARRPYAENEWNSNRARGKNFTEGRGNSHVVVKPCLLCSHGDEADVGFSWWKLEQSHPGKFYYSSLRLLSEVCSGFKLCWI